MTDRLTDSGQVSPKMILKRHLAADGTLALPAYPLSSTDRDSGVYGVSDNTGALVAGGVEKLRWDPTGVSLDGGTTYLSANGPQPNLVLNSDFSRRTIFGLAMPEVFADLSGTTKIDAGAAGSVAANVFTQGAANNEYAWCAGSFVWRDGRASATFKMVSTVGLYHLRWRISATDFVRADWTVGTLYMQKTIAGVTTNLGSAVVAGTLNRWYWLEIEKKGTTFTISMYDTGGTVPGVVKASSTLLQTLTFTVADASVQVGAHISITSDQATAQWGGIATGNGGVYVETLLPESCSIGFAGTLGGQAIGYDESADSGPLSKQNAVRIYIPPAASNVRGLNVSVLTQDGSVNASAPYVSSVYLKTSGKSGSGQLAVGRLYEANSAQTLGSSHDMDTSDATSWTRQTSAFTTAATARRAFFFIYANLNLTASLGGTVYFMLPQLEIGTAATAWRAAPADDAPIVWTLRKTATTTIASATLAEIDPRDLAINVFLPWDANVVATADVNIANSGANANRLAFYSAAAIMGGTTYHASDALGTTAHQMTARAQQGIAAGKTRIALLWAAAAGTATLNAAPDAIVTVTATRGK